MLHPSYTDLINAVNSDVEPGEQPVVQSRYSIVIATAKRARQLIEEENLASLKELETHSHKIGKKPLSVAIDELYTAKIKIVSDEDYEEEDVPSGYNHMANRSTNDKMKDQ